jgi:hypothetical protein
MLTNVFGCLAYVKDGKTIFVNRRWARCCHEQGHSDEVEEVLRHEWLHLLAHRRPDVVRRLGVPASYNGLTVAWNCVRWYLGIIDYRDVHLEEALAERVETANPRTLRAIARHLAT